MELVENFLLTKFPPKILFLWRCKKRKRFFDAYYFILSQH